MFNLIETNANLKGKLYNSEIYVVCKYMFTLIWKYHKGYKMVILHSAYDTCASITVTLE